MLTLDDGTSISGGTLSLGSTSFTDALLDIEAGSGGSAHGATLDDVTVNDSGTINVGLASAGSSLTLDDGTSLNGGTVGTLDINNGSSVTFDDASASATTITVGNAEPFSPLSDLSEGGGMYALGINDGGDTVGYYYDQFETANGFLDIGGTETTFDVWWAGGQGTFISGIDNDGIIVGYAIDAGVISGSPYHGFIATPDNGSYNVVALDDPDAIGGSGESTATYATAINAGANGAAPEVAGYYYDASGNANGFVYTGSLTTIGSGFVTVDDPNGSSGTIITGINDSGEVAGYYIDGNGEYHGFTATPDVSGNYDAGAFTDITDPNAGTFGTYARGINDAGAIVGYYYDRADDIHGFIYENGVFINLDDPSTTNGTYGAAINNSGEVAGYELGSDDADTAFEIQTGTSLTLNNGTLLSGDTLDIGAGSLVAVENGNVQGIGATMDDVQVANAGTIQVDGGLSGVTLILSDGTGVTGGILSIGSVGILDVEGGAFSTDVTLDGVTVDNTGSIEVGASSSIVLTLDDGTMIEGGALTVNGVAELDVEYGANGPGATLDNVSVDGAGTIVVDHDANGADLVLSGDTDITTTTLSIAAIGVVKIAADIVAGDYISPTLTSLAVENNGTIEVDPNATLLIGGSVTLDGGGKVELTSGTEQFAADIAGSDSGGTLDNINNTIVGAGDGTSIGIGDQSLTFINETNGVVDADGSLNSLALDTGNAVTNDGTLEATNGGTLYIDDAVTNNGNIVADGGTVRVVDLEGGAITGSPVEIKNGGLFDFEGASGAAVTFGTGGGTLELDQSDNFTGYVSGFGSAATINLSDIGYSSNPSVVWTQTTTANGGSGTLQVFEVSNLIETLTLYGMFVQADFALTPDNAFTPDTNVVWADTFNNADGDGDFEWFTAGNWSAGAVPGLGNQAQIASNVNFSAPSPDAPGTTVGSVVVDANETLNIVSGTLTVTGNGSNIAGSINAQAGAIDLDGSVAIANTGELISTGGPIVIAGNVQNGNSIFVSDGSTIEFGTHNGVSITGGSLSIGTTAETADIFSVDNGYGGTLDGVMVHNYGSIDVGLADGGHLTLTDGTTIDGGTLSIGGSGIVEVENGVHGAAALSDLTVENSGGLQVDNGVTLALNNVTISGGTLTDNGIIEAASGTSIISAAVAVTGAFIIDDSVVLQFDGAVGGGANISFADGSGTLYLTAPTNFSGEILGISGSGDIIDLQGYDTSAVASTSGGFNGTTTTLTITDPGHTTLEYVLAGNLSGDTWTVSEDSNNAGIDIADPPAVSGVSSGGAGPSPDAPIVIGAGASHTIDAVYDQTVAFTGGIGSLVLNDPEGFSGQIIGFAGTAPDAAHSDTVDLVGINYDSSHFAESYNSSTGLLTVTDGSDSAHLTFDNFNATLDFASDGNGGTLITDPPAGGSAGDSTAGTPVKWGMNFGDDKINFDPVEPGSQRVGAAAPDGEKTTPAVGDSGHDNFVFHANLGAETSADLNSHSDANGFANHPNTELAQQLTALTTAGPHAAAGFEFFHDDIMTPTGTTPVQIHQLIQAGHLLH
jgi:fibronectin-binding autotransporter adhesin